MGSLHWWRRLTRWSRTRDGAGFLALLALALIVRLVLAPLPGVRSDLSQLIAWGRVEHQHFWQFYSVSAQQGLFANYPPLTIYLLGALTLLYTLLGGQTFSDQAPALAALIKLPALFADLGMVSLLYWIGRRRLSPAASLGVAASYAFCPAVILNSMLWGQLEALFILPLCGALVLTQQRRGAAAGLLFGIAIMLKPQPLVFAPLLLVSLWRWAGPKQALRAALAASAFSLLACLPYLIPPSFELGVYVQNISAHLRSQPYISSNAYNLWWLLGVQRQAPEIPLLGPLSATLLGAGLVLVGLALTLTSVWRNNSQGHIFLSAGLLVTAFFVLTTQQHERYLLPALALFAVAALYGQSVWPASIAYTIAWVTASLNMGVVILQSADPGSTSALHQFLQVTAFVPTLVALANVALLAYCSILFAPLLRRQTTPALALSPALSPALGDTVTGGTSVGTVATAASLARKTVNRARE